MIWQNTPAFQGYSANRMPKRGKLSGKCGVKEVWGSGQQQVRNIWTNLAVYNLNLWMHTLVELWAWNKSHEELCDRSDSPWDDAQRRPSHANRRKALRRQILRNELSTITTTWSLPRKIIQLAENLMALAA